jgi:dTDP-4-dehydrorhamnose 3,5-epimerase
MEFKRCQIAGAWVIEASPFVDSRGRFARAWCQREFEDHGIGFSPVQGNMALSTVRGTVRGLHYQVAPALEAKLVRCTRGSVFDVVLDMREDSKTFGAWHSEKLSAENGRMLLVPEGCAHGCQSLEDESEIYYLTTAFYTPSSVSGIRFDDPTFGIDWPLEVSAVSEQDRTWPLWNGKKSWRQT